MQTLKYELKSEPSEISTRKFPLWGYIGLVMIVVGWITAWNPLHPLSLLSFDLLWFGLIFAVDGLNVLRRGSSILSKYPGKFFQLFIFSSLIWWLFEALNERVQNWHYLLDHPTWFSWDPLISNLAASISFSTVLPAVMELSAFIMSFNLFRPSLGPKMKEPQIPLGWLIGEIILGVLSLGLALLFPHEAFPLIWLGPLFVIDAFNAFVGYRSSIGRFIVRDLRWLIAIPIATLCCGFFWEMWNYWSLPKWYYTIPYVGFAKIFEMPLLGYLGYLPFGLELFALYQFLLWATRQREDALPF